MTALSTNVTIEFKPTKSRSGLADCSLLFQGNILNNVRLIGITIVKNESDELTVVFPSYRYPSKFPEDAGKMVPFFFLRANGEDLDVFADMILDAYEKWVEEQQPLTAEEIETFKKLEQRMKMKRS